MKSDNQIFSIILKSFGLLTLFAFMLIGASYGVYSLSTGAGAERNVETVPTYNPPSITNHKPETQICSYCKGTGWVTCTMCGGTGINNMGVPCGCLRANKVLVEMGKEPDPYLGPHHKCIMCHGTGLK